MAKRYIILDKGILRCYDKDGTLRFTASATTGRKGCTQSWIQNCGPIPEGNYTLKPDETDGGIFKAFVWNILRREDWGFYRVRLHPDEGTYMPNGRDNFFLHGGNWRGTAGCIDADNDIIYIIGWIREHEEHVSLIVSANPTNWTDEEIAEWEQSEQYKEAMRLREEQGW